MSVSNIQTADFNSLVGVEFRVLVQRLYPRVVREDKVSDDHFCSQVWLHDAPGRGPGELLPKSKRHR